MGFTDSMSSGGQTGAQTGTLSPAKILTERRRGQIQDIAHHRETSNALNASRVGKYRDIFDIYPIFIFCMTYIIKLTK